MGCVISLSYCSGAPLRPPTLRAFLFPGRGSCPRVPCYGGGFRGRLVFRLPIRRGGHSLLRYRRPRGVRFLGAEVGQVCNFLVFRGYFLRSRMRPLSAIKGVPTRYEVIQSPLASKVVRSFPSSFLPSRGFLRYHACGAAMSSPSGSEYMPGWCCF